MRIMESNKERFLRLLRGADITKPAWFSGLINQLTDRFAAGYLQCLFDMISKEAGQDNPHLWLFMIESAELKIWNTIPVVFDDAKN